MHRLVFRVLWALPSGVLATACSQVDRDLFRSSGAAGAHCGVVAKGHILDAQRSPMFPLFVAIMGGPPMDSESTGVTGPDGAFSLSTYGACVGSHNPFLVIADDETHMICAIRAKGFRYHASDLRITVHDGGTGCSWERGDGSSAR